MSTLTWTGNAHSVKQISTITVANTWAAADTCTITINGKDLVITCGSTTTTTATVAAAIKEAWMSNAGLDGSSASSNATSNFGGQEFGEFREMIATVSGSVVTLTGKTSGKPVTIAVAEDTAGSGTATLATPQAATGCNHWNNGDNWDTGSVPVDDDICVFRDSSISVLYGLPNSTDLEATIQVWRSYTGEIGLRPINRDDPAFPYYEYRQRYVRLDDGGTGTNIAHRFGLGDTGNGSQWIAIKHSTVQCSPIVFFTGRPKYSGEYCLNICCTANTSSINILEGSVDFSSQDGSTSAFVSVQQSGGSSVGITAVKATDTIINMNGGTMLLGGTAAIATIYVFGGSLRFENQTATISALHINKGATVEYASTGTCSAGYVSGGTLDFRDSAGTAIFTALHLYEGSKLLDPYSRMTCSNDIDLYFNPSSDIQLGANQTSPVQIITN